MVACKAYLEKGALILQSNTVNTYTLGLKKKFMILEFRVIKTEYFEHKVSQKHCQELVTRLVCHLCVVCFLFVCFFKCSFSSSCLALLKVSQREDMLFLRANLISALEYAHAVLCVYLASSFDPWL